MTEGGQGKGRRAGEGVQDDKSYVILSEAPALSLEGKNLQMNSRSFTSFRMTEKRTG